MAADVKSSNEVLAEIYEQTNSLYNLIENMNTLPEVPTPIKVAGVHASVGLLKLKLAILERDLKQCAPNKS